MTEQQHGQTKQVKLTSNVVRGISFLFQVKVTSENEMCNFLSVEVIETG